MKISKKFSLLNNQKAVIAVTGKQAFKIYLIHDGEIDLMKFDRILPLRYSDKEGSFANPGKGELLGRGVAYDYNKEKMLKDFLKDFEENLKDIVTKNQVVTIYIFCPVYIMHDIINLIKNSLRGVVSIRLTFEGNYFYDHPFTLLEKIDAFINEIIEEQKLAEANEEVIKILKKPKF